MRGPLLAVRGLTMRFGGITALANVSFTVDEGAITALIGPNGAGKTTVFNCVTGFYRASAGQILLATPQGPLPLGRLLGEPLHARDLFHPARLKEKIHYKMFGGSHLVTRAGLARTFQNIRLFKEMTTMENLLVAQHQRIHRNLLAGVFKSERFRQSESDAVARAASWLDFFDLLDDANRLAGELPYGHQRRLEMARALCTEPRLLCLDEPAAGLNPRETRELSQLICRLRDEHRKTILMIEHDMSLVMDISEHVVVLDHGEVIAAGNPQQVQNDAAVLSAYLGVDEP